MAKRLFDLFFSCLGLLFLCPFFILIAILVKLDSPGPVFFRQERVGRSFHPFRIFKFRTMIANAFSQDSLITVEGDPRITRIGKYLRRHKIDELPQLINVLMGDMSLVGTRPEMKKYVELFRQDYEKLLRSRPGITGPAAIAFFREENILSASLDAEKDYIEKVLPEKIRLALAYTESPSLLKDIKLILLTIFKI